jgi:transposase
MSQAGFDGVLQARISSWGEEAFCRMPAPKKYPDELRERAVRLVVESGRPIAHIAKDLGIHREALRQWVRQAEADQGSRQDRLTTDERERLKSLEREVRELRKANEILRAASVYFAKELDPTRPK